MMKKIFCLLMLPALAPVFTIGQTTWVPDQAHSNVKFTVTHMVVAEVEGRFKSFTGSVITKDDSFENAQIDFSVDISSITTDNEMRDNHLKSDDFFNADKFPKMTFKSESFKKTDGNKFKLTGNLTIRDVTKPVTFDVTLIGTAKDGQGNLKAGFAATTVIKRLEYGLKWNKMIEAGAVVSDDVQVKLNLELKKNP